MNFNRKYKFNMEQQGDSSLGYKPSFEEEIIYNDFKKRRTISITNEINDKTEFLVNHMIQQLCKEERDGSKLPIKIKISSPGGSALSCFSIVDSIESAKESGYPVITEGYSTVMSAAVPILSSGTIGMRRTQKKSRWMVHDVGVFLIGNMSGEEISRLNSDIQETSKMYEDIIVSTSKMTSENFREHCSKLSEFYFWGKDALDMGFVDELF
jgi:ATP-dependent protease ClpP protease subunit